MRVKGGRRSAQYYLVGFLLWAALSFAVGATVLGNAPGLIVFMVGWVAGGMTWGLALRGAE